MNTIANQSKQGETGENNKGPPNLINLSKPEIFRIFVAGKTACRQK